MNTLLKKNNPKRMHKMNQGLSSVESLPRYKEIVARQAKSNPRGPQENTTAIYDALMLTHQDFEREALEEPMTKSASLPPVRKTAQMLEIEKANGNRDIRLIIKDLYEQTGSQVEVAKSLGLEQSTVSFWALRLGITFVQKPAVEITSTAGR